MSQEAGRPEVQVVVSDLELGREPWHGLGVGCQRRSRREGPHGTWRSRTDPTQEAPAEDTILSTTSGPANGVASATTFTQASSNKAQLCRVVFKARTSGATEGTGRVWLAAAVRYA